MDSAAPIGMIGLGLMGAALSRRLIDAGLAVLGFDIDPGRCETLKAGGGALASSPRDVMRRCRTVILAVYDGKQVEALLGETGGEAIEQPPVVICTTTCTPDEIARIAGLADGRKWPFVEAPISGTSFEVRNGSATALIAGDPGAIKAAAAVLTILCPRRIPIGAIGDASKAKLAINLILQNNRAALAEGIAFAERLGLDGTAFLEAACASAAYSSVMDTKGGKMLARDFSPQSHIAQTLKDAELILAEAASRGLQLPVTTAQTGLLRAAIALEGPDSDSSAVIEAVRRFAPSKDTP